MKKGRASKYSEIVRADRLGELFDLAYEHIKVELKGGDKKWATEQVMRLVAKTIPQQTELTGKDGKDLFPKPLLTNVSSNNGDPQGSGVKQKNKGGTGGDISKQDNLDTLLSD